MDLNWLESILYGFFSGMMDILPVSAEAHKVLLLKFFGKQGNLDMLDLLVHLSILGALYVSCQSHIVRIRRARALARIPKKKRKRPLDTRTLMDWSMLKTMTVPVILGLILYRYTAPVYGNLLLMALFLFLNGLILYVPQFLPPSNRDSRTLSRIEGLLMGLGGAVSIIPGISAIGAATTVGSVCGVERNYSLTMALMLNMVLMAGMVVYDVLGIMANGLGLLSLAIILRYLLTAVVSFGGTILGVKIMRYLAENQGFSLFGVYCWGLALFTFILNLMA